MTTEEKQIRVRLTELEIRFIVHAVKGYELFLSERAKQLDEKERWLKREFVRSTSYDVLKQLKATRREIEAFKTQAVSRQGIVCRDFARRFNGLLAGRKLHSRCDYWLRTLNMNPK